MVIELLFSLYSPRNAVSYKDEQGRQDWCSQFLRGFGGTEQNAAQYQDLDAFVKAGENKWKKKSVGCVFKASENNWKKMKPIRVINTL